MKKKFIAGIAAAAVIGSASIWAVAQKDNNATQSDGIVHYVSNNSNSSPYNGTIDFSTAAEQTVKSVVHITTRSEQVSTGFFGTQRTPQFGSGSGVVISEDGYIVTNNHVVQGSNEVRVTFSNNVTKTAKVIGTDPATDLAVIKVDGNKYPYIVFGNSDDVKLGQWVLAVGYPLNLDATVTAGIVSAKSRNIGINRRNSNFAIESFIQTDAAVNMGNSGGALVSTDGLLIGINSAIATPTGTYAGYSYAIPSNLVRKVVNDLIDFGNVQRGFIGAQLIDMSNVNGRTLDQLGLSENIMNGDIQGVIVADVVNQGGAQLAGLKRGDIITSINGITTNNSSQLMEQVAMHNPGDKVDVRYYRDGGEYNAHITLRSEQEISGNSLASAPSNNKKSERSAPRNSGNAQFYSEKYGFGVQSLSSEDLQYYGLQHGVEVSDIDPKGRLSSNFMGDMIREGFVITKINGKDVNSADDVREALDASKGLSLSGTYPRTGERYSIRIN